MSHQPHTKATPLEAGRSPSGPRSAVTVEVVSREGLSSASGPAAATKPAQCCTFLLGHCTAAQAHSFELSALERSLPASSTLASVGAAWLDRGTGAADILGAARASSRAP